MNSGLSLMSQAVAFGKESAFKAALPLQIGRWAPEILQASRLYGVSPWMLAGIMLRESQGGATLTPPNNPAGTGDFTPRLSGTYAKYAGANGLPADGAGGWGRGLMQIDYGAHNAWVTSNAWWDPQTNINKSADILRTSMRFFSAIPPAGATVKIEPWRVTNGKDSIKIAPWLEKYKVPASAAGASFKDPRPLSGTALQEAVFAAYNAGDSGVLQAVALGLPAEAATTGQDYVAWLTTRVAAWWPKFQSS